MKYYIFLLFAAGMPAVLLAQTVRGEIRNRDTNHPIAGAWVVYYDWQQTWVRQQTEDAGIFQLDSLASGTGYLTVQAPGYAPFSLRDVQVVAGKERVVIVYLIPGKEDVSATQLDYCEDLQLRQIAPIGEIPLSRNQMQLFPAMFNDPARLAAAWPGVVQPDDRANRLSIRGNNPMLLQWKLNGMDIVSPNHFPNIGTYGEQPSLTGGAIPLISPQIIDNSTLFTGAGAPGFNDGIGGVMNLNLRKGNNQQHEQTIQLGSQGLEISIEGPSRTVPDQSSYLMNFRYSTLGLLHEIDALPGKAKTNFRDFAIHLCFPGRRKEENTWSLFYIWGRSKDSAEKKSLPEIYQDLFYKEINTKSLVTGFSHKRYVGRSFFSESGMILSWRFTNRKRFLNSHAILKDYVDEAKAAFRYSARWTSEHNFALLFGVNATAQGYHSYPLRGSDWQSVPQIRGESFPGNCWLVGESALTGTKIKLQYGITPVISEYNHHWAPRIQIYWKPDSIQQLVLSVTSYSQASPFWADSRNKQLIAANYSARYTYRHNATWLFTAEAFSQGSTGYDIISNLNNGFSSFNEDYPIFFNRFAVQDGTAHSYGIELMALRRFSQGWFLNANATLLRSVYQGSDGITRRSRWDVGQIANLTAGREWHRKNRRKLSGRLFGVDGRAVFSGGMRSTPVDASASAAQSQTVFIYTNGYSEKEKPYFRLDGRIYWKRSIQNRRNSTFALEFQNLTMQQNLAYRYFDPYTQQVESKYQLGLVPNLSWRVEL